MRSYDPSGLGDVHVGFEGGAAVGNLLVSMVTPLSRPKNAVYRQRQETNDMTSQLRLYADK